MNRYYTLMLIPEQNQKIHSFRVPIFLIRSFSLALALIFIMIFVFAYDYKQVLNQVYENKHLELENRKLRDQLNIFSVRMNTLNMDLQRIQIFEKKLRLITGTTHQMPVENRLSPTFDSELEAAPEKSQEDQGEETQKPPPRAESLTDNTQEAAPEGPTALFINEKFLTLPFQQFRSTEQKDFSFLNEEAVKKLPSYGDIQNQHRSKLEGMLGKFYGDHKVNLPIWNDLQKRTLLLADHFASFEVKYAYLKRGMKDLEVKINKMDEILLDKESLIRSTPTLIPAKGWITSFYGSRTSPYSGQLKMHEGLDIGAPVHTLIVAPADGMVIFSGEKSGFGKFVQLDHGYGMETLFGHASQLLVHAGQKIKRGDSIARVGNTGLSTGPHLHYEVRVNGMAVDPFYFVLD